VRKAANDDDSAWEAVNESTSVNGTNKGMSRGEAEVANTNATEVAETAATTETAAKPPCPPRAIVVSLGRGRSIRGSPAAPASTEVNVKIASASGAQPS